MFMIKIEKFELWKVKKLIHKSIPRIIFSLFKKNDLFFFLFCLNNNNIFYFFAIFKAAIFKDILVYLT